MKSGMGSCSLPWEKHVRFLNQFLSRKKVQALAKSQVAMYAGWCCAKNGKREKGKREGKEKETERSCEHWESPVELVL